MKKLVFTIQVIVLLAIFPVYLVVELNHQKEKPTAAYQASAFQEEIEINTIK